MQSLSISWIRTLLGNWNKVFALQVLIQVLLLHANLNIIYLVLVRSRHRSQLLNDHFCYLRFDVSFATLLHYLALVGDDLPQFFQGEVLEDEGLPLLIAEFLEHFDERFVLFVEAYGR